MVEKYLGRNPKNGKTLKKTDRKTYKVAEDKNKVISRESPDS